MLSRNVCSKCVYVYIYNIHIFFSTAFFLSFLKSSRKEDHIFVWDSIPRRNKLVLAMTTPPNPWREYHFLDFPNITFGYPGVKSFLNECWQPNALVSIGLSAIVANAGL